MSIESVALYVQFVYNENHKSAWGKDERTIDP